MGSVYRLLLVFAMFVAMSHCSRDVFSTTQLHPDEKFGIHLKKTTVRFYNELGNDRNLKLHCMSKDDDLGFHDLPSQGSYEWKFRINFQETTDFFCELASNDKKLAFVSFDAKRDKGRCKECVWRVRDDGAHGYGSNDPVDDDKLLARWNNAGEPQLTSVSNKFLLPFVGRLLPWIIRGTMPFLDAAGRGG